jgi:hypothetical protein
MDSWEDFLCTKFCISPIYLTYRNMLRPYAKQQRKRAIKRRAPDYKVATRRHRKICRQLISSQAKGQQDYNIPENRPIKKQKFPTPEKQNKTEKRTPTTWQI